MNFQVPQFIDIEDKIVANLSFKQFLYLLGGGAGAFVLVKLLPLYLGIFFALPVVVFALALAFYKVNNRPFIYVLESWFNYVLKGKLYLWKTRKPEPKSPASKDQVPEEEVNYVPKLSSSKLKEMSWSLDILDNKKSEE